MVDESAELLRHELCASPEISPNAPSSFKSLTATRWNKGSLYICSYGDRRPWDGLATLPAISFANGYDVYPEVSPGTELCSPGRWLFSDEELEPSLNKYPSFIRIVLAVAGCMFLSTLHPPGGQGRVQQPGKV